MLERSALEATGRLAALDERGPVRAGAIELERLAPGRGEHATCVVPGAGEQLLYVIHGSGTARVEEGELRLARETVLWLAAGERATLTAGEDGLEALVARVSG